jgi:nucleotide-binding universal stress UspA family protein
MFTSIVVGTDGSDTAIEAVRNAAQLADSCGAKLHLVVAHTPAPGAKLAAGSSIGTEAAYWLANPDFKADAVLEKAAGVVRQSGVEPELHAPRGDAAEALLDVAAECGADLIVVGNRGMTGSRRFLGSIPNKLSHHAGCSVMIVQTSGR